MKSTCSHHQRRGAAATLFVISMPVFIGFAALALDLGLVCTTKTELQRAADAAAMAGASAYLTDAGLKEDHSAVTKLADSRAQAISKPNVTIHASTLLDIKDIALGTHDPDNWKGSLTQSGRWNAVDLTVRRTAGSLNGSIPFLFSRFFGKNEGGTTAHARAAVDDHFAGYDLKKSTQALIPFTISESLYEQLAQSGPDQYSYDGSIHGTSDKISEVRLFPWKAQNIAGEDGKAGSGNFGTLNVGANGQGTSYLSSQIENGIPNTDLQSEFGTSELKFYDSSGGAKTYSGTGNPGLSTGISSSVNARLGQVVGFFVHNSFTDNGSNTTYQISGIRFGRIMAVDLTGSPKTRTISIQPVAYTDVSVIVDPEAPSTNGKIVRIFLVQ
jgi:Putative Flp pilus-assembly TadE/G-like